MSTIVRAAVSAASAIVADAVVTAAATTAQFQAAITATPNGGVVYLPDGHTLTGKLVVDKPITLRGNGWGLNGNTPTGSVITVASGVQTGITSAIEITGDYVRVQDIAVQGAGAANGSAGIRVLGSSGNFAHGVKVDRCFIAGFGRGLALGAYSDHATATACKIAGNTYGAVFEVNNNFDYAFIDCMLDGNVTSSLHLEANQSVANVSCLRTHLGFSQYGITQDAATTTGDGYSGLTLLDSPIEHVTVQQSSIVNGGNIHVGGGYWTWSGTPANPALAIGAVNIGPIWFRPRLESGTPNANSPAVINVSGFTSYPIYADAALNGFAQAMFAGNYKSPRVQVLTATGSYTVPAGVHRLRVQGRGGGGGGGGGGAANTSGGVATQVGGGGGAAGSVAEKVLDVQPGQTYTVTINAGGTRGTGGTANGGAGSNGGNGGDATFTGTGGTVFCKGGQAGLGSAGNSTTAVSGGTYGSRSARLTPGTETGGCGGGATSTLAYPGGDPIASSGAGGGAGGPATATLGGGGGLDGTTLGGTGGASGASATTAGVVGHDAFNERGSGGGGGGGGAPGGAGGQGGTGTAGMFVVEALG